MVHHEPNNQNEDFLIHEYGVGESYIAFNLIDMNKDANLVWKYFPIKYNIESFKARIIKLPRVWTDGCCRENPEEMFEIIKVNIEEEMSLDSFISR